MRQNLLDQVVIVVALSVQKPELAEAGQHHLLKTDKFRWSGGVHSRSGNTPRQGG